VAGVSVEIMAIAARIESALRRLAGASVVSLAACTLPPNFQVNPEPITADTQLPPNSAVLLVGVTGPRAVTGIQLCHTKVPCITVLGITDAKDRIVAVRVPAGLKGLHVESVLLEGSAYYRTVHTTPIDIDKAGIYYVATIDSLNVAASTQMPIESQLHEVRDRLGSAFGKLEPVNFQWPR
jgi:hypothetical protein